MGCISISGRRFPIVTSSFLLCSARVRAPPDEPDGEQKSRRDDEHTPRDHARDQRGIVIVCGHCIELKEHKTAYAEHEREQPEYGREPQTAQSVFSGFVRRPVQFLRDEDAGGAAPRDRQRHQQQTHRPAHDDLPARKPLREARGDEIGKREQDKTRRQKDKHRARPAPLHHVGNIPRRRGHGRRIFGGGMRFRGHGRGIRAAFRHGCVGFRLPPPAQKLIDRNAEDGRERHELRRFGKRLARLPFGNCLIRNVQHVGKFLLRHPLPLAERI